MGQGQELMINTGNQNIIEITERGEIFFFYRPKVGKEEACRGPDDVQRLYIVMWPESGERPVEEKQDPHSGKEGEKRRSKNTDYRHEGGQGSQEVNIEKQILLRLLVIGKKSLPDSSKKRRRRPHWGFVEMVTTKVEGVKNVLEGGGGGRARALGEGIYRILRHQNSSSNKGSHTHLVYKLELPEEAVRGGPQESMNVKRECSFLIQIKNPEQQPPQEGFRGLQRKRKAVFPAHLQALFGKSKRFSAADPPDFLNYEGCEFLLIGASDDIQQELGLELKTEVESSSSIATASGSDNNSSATSSDYDSDGQDDSHNCSSDLINTFGETSSTVPLLRGTWV